MRDFHSADWPERAALIGQFSDDRYRRLAQRLVYFERPELLPVRSRSGLASEIAKRISDPPEAQVPWRSIAAALHEAEQLMRNETNATAIARLRAYSQYLLGRLQELCLQRTRSGECVE
jgi:hypothetical protein